MKRCALCSFLLLAAMSTACDHFAISCALLCPKREIKAGEVIREDDLLLMGRAISVTAYYSREFAMDRFKVVGHKAKHTLPRGQPLHRSDIER